MPYKKSNNKYRRRRPRRARRRYQSAQPSTAIQSRPSANSSQIVKMRYCDKIQINAGAGTIGRHSFRANSVYDPDFTGTGHQPMSHDEWSNFYQHYTVIGSKINVKFLNEGITANDNVFVSVQTTSTSSDGTGLPLSTYVEQGRGGWKILGRGDGGKAFSTVNAFYSPKKFFGVKDVRDNQTLTSNFGGNPSEDAYFQIGVETMLSSADPDVLQALVTIDYIVLLTEPKFLLQS